MMAQYFCPGGNRPTIPSQQQEHPMAYYRPKAPEETYKFAQCFGDKNDHAEVNEADIISAISFDKTGNFLASGDRAGRVVLFERNQQKGTCEYRFYTEFQSHEAEFDYLKSLDINEKINKIAWCQRVNDAHLLLTTNDKTIKLWKVKERDVQSVVENNSSINKKLAQTDVRIPISLPKTVRKAPSITAAPKRNFSNAHAYHIHSISMSPDGEMFLSADDLRVNIWDLNRSEQSFNIVDLKPPNIEALKEVITSTQFHPHHDHMFVYSTSQGAIRLGDMRQSALCDRYAKNFTNVDTCNNSFFSDIVKSVSDVKFSQCGRYFATRDYLSMQVWDMHMEAKPLKIIPVHDAVKPKLCDLYENDIIFDKFEVSFNHDGTSVMSGSYSNYLRVNSVKDDTCEVIHADKSIFRKKPNRPKIPGQFLLDGSNQRPMDAAAASALGEIDFSKRIFTSATHPAENTVAIASTCNLFIFSQK